MESDLRMCFPLGRPSSLFCFITPALCGGFALACHRLEGPPLPPPPPPPPFRCSVLWSSSELNGETSLPPEQRHIHSPSISRQRSVTQTVGYQHHETVFDFFAFPSGVSLRLFTSLVTDLSWVWAPLPVA